MDLGQFEKRPIIVAIAGPNGAGKSTFYNAFLARSGFPFVNADLLAAELGCGAYEAADLAKQRREELLAANASFIFETVFSDPVGDKVDFLCRAQNQGYEVVLSFIRLNSPHKSQERVSARVRKGGHDVPDEKLVERFPRSLANLKRAIDRLPHVLIFDNTDLDNSFQPIAVFTQGVLVEGIPPLPTWLQSLIP